MGIHATLTGCIINLTIGIFTLHAYATVTHEIRLKTNPFDQIVSAFAFLNVKIYINVFFGERIFVGSDDGFLVQVKQGNIHS